MHERLCLALIVTALSGCASYEWRNDRPDAHWASDLNECRSAAFSTFPKVIVQEQEIDRAATDKLAAQQQAAVAAASSQTSSTTCDRSRSAVHCRTISSGSTPQVVVVQAPPVVYRTRTVDVNARDREQFEGNCIASMGWQRVRVDK